MQSLIPLFVLAPIGITFYLITKVLTDYFLRKKMVEKGMLGEDATKILTKELNTVNKFSSLKWGLITLSSGIGLVLIEYLVDFEENTALPFGILAISISLGFLVYYFIVKNARKE